MIFLFLFLFQLDFEDATPDKLTWEEYATKFLDPAVPLLSQIDNVILFEKVRENRLEEVKDIINVNRLLIINWKHPNRQDNSEWTALHMACDRGHLQLVQVLLAHPAIDVNLQSSSGSTPLLFACVNGQFEVVKLLLRDGRAKMNVPDSQGRTPLWHATSNDHLKIVQLLLLVGGKTLDVRQGGSYRDQLLTPLDLAKELRKTRIQPLLESFERDPEHTREEIRKDLGVRGM